MLGASVRFFERRFEEGYAVDPDRVAAALSPRTRLVVLSSPHNPTGVLAAEDALARLGALAEKHGFLILVDEVYQDCVLTDRPKPAALRSPAFISSNSLTKAYGLSSLRCGWTLASPEVTLRVRRARGVVDVNGAIPAERLATLAFTRLDELSERARRLIGANTALVSAFLAKSPALECVPSRATITFPRFKDGRDTGPFAQRLFAEHGVAIVPGAFFEAPSHFRLSFGGATDKLQKGLAALTSCLQS